VAAEKRLVRGAIYNELFVASRYSSAIIRGELEAAGVAAEEYNLVSFVGFLQPVTPTDLGRACGITRTTLRDAIARSIERGHLDQVPNPDDARSHLLRLTQSGEALLERGLPAVQRALLRLEEALDRPLDEYEESVWRLRRTLQRLAGED
jgi:MarR family transcriptional regulator, 2-MHQ and catechol-resistance regulon repressor